MNDSAGMSPEEIASLWAARIDGGTLSPVQRDELESWLRRDPRHLELLRSYGEFSGDLEEALPQLIARGGTSFSPLSVERKRRPALLLSFVGATLAAAAAVLFILRTGETPSTVALTGGPKLQHVSLQDGTQIDLGVRTDMVAELTSSERRVHLQTGQAFFSVSKDSRRPFLVDTPAGTVRVTGTQFGVQSDPAKNFAVVVVEGSVQVNTAGKSAASPLRPGDKLEARAGRVAVTTLAKGEVDDVLAWRQSKVVFKATRLEDAVSCFSWHHNLEISVSPEIADVQITGRYSLDDLDGFLSSVESVFEESTTPVRVERDAAGRLKGLVRR